MGLCSPPPLTGLSFLVFPQKQLWALAGAFPYWLSCSPGGWDGKESACHAGDAGLIPGKIPWRRAWQPTPVFLLGESHGQRSLEGYSPWGHRELDITEWLTHTQERRADGRTWAHEDFVGGPHVAKMPHSQSRRPDFDLWSGNWIPHAATKSFHAPTKTQCSQISKYYKKKEKEDGCMVLAHSAGSGGGVKFGVIALNSVLGLWRHDAVDLQGQEWQPFRPWTRLMGWCNAW